jgi:hypothetical protein
MFVCVYTYIQKYVYMVCILPPTIFDEMKAFEGQYIYIYVYIAFSLLPVIVYIYRRIYDYEYVYMKTYMYI